MSDRFSSRQRAVRIVGALLLVLTVLAACRRNQPQGQPGRPPQFEDVTASAGIQFTHNTGAFGEKWMPEIVGPGCAALDYDQDGLFDLVLVNGSAWPGKPGTLTYPALYRNLGDGRFDDVTESAGLKVASYGMGVAVGDYDNDGWSDLLITALGGCRLFHNDKGRFVDVTEAVGLGDMPAEAWHTSAAWLDYDRDGKLDLFVGRYVPWTPGTNIACTGPKHKLIYCGPMPYPRSSSVLFHQEEDGTFRDVSEESGIAAAKGKALGVLPLDENGDGWPDIYVANDAVPNHLFRNLGGTRFEEVAQLTGVAVSQAGLPRGSMGVDAADLFNDGGHVLAVGNLNGEGLGMFLRSGGGVYADQATALGAFAPSLSYVTFGVAFLDADGDGWQDFLAINGHVDDLIEETGASTTFAQLPLLLWNRRGTFEEVTSRAGAPLQKPLVGRGLAIVDWDNDGRPDALVTENRGEARLWRNVTEFGNWVGIRLVGERSNRDGFGAEVWLSANGVTQRRWVRSGGSYLSSSDPRALFGLGNTSKVDRVEIRWPSGQVDVHRDVAINRYLRAVEGASALEAE